MHFDGANYSSRTANITPNPKFRKQNELIKRVGCAAPRAAERGMGALNPSAPQRTRARGRSTPLSKISCAYSLDREILVQIRPMNAEWRNLDMVQLRRCSRRKARILRHRKTNFFATPERDHDQAISINRRFHAIRQSAHATFG